ncbi:FHA domain-containing protein [Leptospira fletcheri]|uniref:FHA domain-containing protein n=1 Tax=Leptospira fletcheri TaxID=2484981 RepID=A0A4R9GJP9_9LEPT|nr:FHA domain-containing protein [Leptospira fletcheri]TGK13877.1 FHA domain-containing protein [Leptospira fletcheri]
MRVIFRTILLFCFLSSLSASYAESKGIVLEEGNVSSYPKVTLKIKENRKSSPEREILVLRERKDSRIRRVLQPEIFQEEGTRPIHLHLLVQMSDSFDSNVQGTEILKRIVQASGEEDRFSFVFFTDDVFLPKSDLSKATALKEAKLPGGKTNQNTSSNLDYVFQKISPHIGKRDYVLLVFFDREFMPSQEARRGGYLRDIPLNILGNPSEGTARLAEIYGGFFHSIQRTDSLSRVLTDIEFFRKRPWTVRYDSPFGEDWNWGSEDKVYVELETRNFGKILYDYTLPWTTRSILFLLHPRIFLPTVGFLLIVTMIAFLFVLKRNDRRSPSHAGSIAEERLHTLDDEQDAYRKMYGDQYQLMYSEDNRIQTDRLTPVAVKEFEDGEAYEKATLILKEGRHPGKQYSLQKSQTVLGNSELADLVLYEQGVSGNHARIRRVKNRFILYDLVSESGTYLNGKKVLRPRILYDFDEIGIGKALLVFRGK